jgi:hypothetical protein
MIALIDPAFFLNCSRFDELECDLQFILQSCRRNRIAVPAIQSYWEPLWNELIRPLERAAPAPVKSTIRELRKLGVSCPSSSEDEVTGEILRLGFSQLFGWSTLAPEWEERMARAAIQAARIAERSRDRVILLVRRIQGRNLEVRQGRSYDSS